MFNKNSKGHIKQVVDYKSMNFRGEVQTENAGFSIISMYTMQLEIP